MFVVMRSGATEAEVNGVKGLILAEGLTPFENAGTSRTVIAVVGELGKRREQLKQRLEATPGVAQVTPISKPYKLVSREFHPVGARVPERPCSMAWPRSQRSPRPGWSATESPAATGTPGSPFTG